MSQVKIFADPVGLHSRAMVRVANAIKKHAPASVTFVNSAEEADVQVMHVIDWDDSFLAWPRPYIAIQYCLETTRQMDMEKWRQFWEGSIVTWSYYDLVCRLHSVGLTIDRDKLFHAPLGADEIFRENAQALLCWSGASTCFGSPRRDLIVTTGYVSGPGAEAIEEVWNAAERTGWAGVHIGPAKVVGTKRKTMPDNWYSAEGCTDKELAAYYRRAYFVAGMRYVEGFELPAIEGALCGALPLIFDQPSQKHWFGGIADYWIPESSTPRELTVQLEEIFTTVKFELQRNNVTSDCLPAGPDAVAIALARFNWASIIPDMFEAAKL